MSVVLSDRSDMLVVQDGTKILHKPRTIAGEEEIENALRFYRSLMGEPFIPELLSEYPMITHFKKRTPVTDETKFYRSVAYCLKTLREAGIIHGDATTRNAFCNDNQIVLTDWKESSMRGEGGRKRPEPDAYHLWRTAAYFSEDTTRRARRWIAIRELIEAHGYETLLDIGTNEGDFCYYAACEGIDAFGIDHWLSWEKMKDIWGSSWNFHYTQIDVKYFSFPDTDITLFMSIFPYIVENQGWQKAGEILHTSLEHTKCLIFESQRYGDGPGPFEFIDQGSIRDYLKAFSDSVEKLVSIPVAGRPHYRTLWIVKGKL